MVTEMGKNVTRISLPAVLVYLIEGIIAISAGAGDASAPYF
jgi:hypothetical protein